MNLIVTQIIVSFILFCGTLICGSIPSVIVRYLESKTRNEIRNETNNKASALSFLMCFGGGILLATCFVHMLPEVRHTFVRAHISQVNSTTNNHDNEGSDFPTAEFVMCCGFFLIYLLEEIIHSCIDSSHRHNESPEVLPQVITCHHSRANSFSIYKNEKHNVMQKLIPKKGRSHKNKDHCVGYGSTIPCQNPSHEKPANESNQLDCQIHVDTIINCETQVGITSYFRSLMIVTALSFHSLFEGLAIGLSNTTTAVWQLLFAVAIHKFVISFAVGLEIYAETFNLTKVSLYMFIFSMGSPIGIIVGAFAKLQVTLIIDAVLNGIATGSILYIVFFEVLTKERHSSKLGRHFQLFGILCGFSVMVSLQLLTNHQH